MIGTTYYIEYARLIETPHFRQDKKYTTELTEEQWMKIVGEYVEYSKKIKDKYEEHIQSFKYNAGFFNSKTCLCGLKLKWNQWGFWGCDNYRDPDTKHIRFFGREPEIPSIYFNVPHLWVTELIKKAGLSKLVSAKSAYDKLLAFGYEDLRVKYDRPPTENTLHSLPKTKQRSQKQEQQAGQHLTTIYDKVIPQQCIEYKLQGEDRKLCIPDFICSTPEKVVVVDAKLDYVNDEKMNLYVALVSHILLAKGDIRPVSGSHIMYEDEKREEWNKQYGVKSIHNLITIPQP